MMIAAPKTTSKTTATTKTKAEKTTKTKTKTTPVDSNILSHVSVNQEPRFSRK
jgi:hypothetical protein